jgi:uncharacterized protein (TIGR03435 family)
MTPSFVVLLLVKITAALMAGLVTARLARTHRAAVRHVVLGATFAVVIALPPAAFVIPSVSINVPVATEPSNPAVVESRAVANGARPGVAGGFAATSSTPGADSRPILSLSAIVLTIWGAGAALFLLPIVVGLAETRSLRRSGLPWVRAQSIADAIAREAGIRRRVDVLVHESTSGPLTFGVTRPAVLLPADAQSWSEEDVRRAVIHELEHIRRRDWPTQCLARAACALYWFHPLVWIAWRQFGLEAERACDDAVLRRSDATDYADQLVGLAKRLSLAGRQPLLAMANRADLSTRVVAVLDGKQPRGRAGRAWIMAACAAAIATISTVSPLRLVASQNASQTASATRDRYDVATIKPCVAEEKPTGARGTAGGTNATFSPGRFSVPCVTTEQLIYLAYAAYGARENEHLANDDFGAASNTEKVRGGPDWVHSLKEKYSIEATAAGATDRYVLMGTMLRSLLEDRFQLKLHRGTEEVPMYELKVAKSGLTITPMKDDECTPFDPAASINPGAAKPVCGNLNMMSANGLTRWTFGGFAFSSLSTSIGRLLKVHVIDRTNVTDKFIMRLEFVREDAGGDAQGAGRDGAALATNGKTIFDALKEIGLELEKTRGPRGFLVIDHIERPTPDGPAAPPPARATGPGAKR